MTNFKFVFSTFLILSFLASSCQKSKTENQEIQRFEINTNSVNDFDETVATVEFIPLLNNPESPINLNCSVWNLFITEKFIVYATICNPNAKIHFFDLNGNYLKTFDKAGEGPTEYQNLQGINLSGDTLTISVGAGVVKHYSMSDFEFIGSQTIDGEIGFLSNFQQISENQWLVSPMFEGNKDENGQFNIFKIINIESKETIELPLKANQLTADISEGEIAKTTNSYLLNYAFSDTISLLEKTDSKPFAVLDFGERAISKQELNKSSEDFESNVIQQPYAFNMGKIWYTDSIARIKTFALTKNPDMDMSNMRTFPIHEVFLNFSTNQVSAFPSFAGWTNGKGFAAGGFFYDVLLAEDWIYAVENGLLGKYGNDLEKNLKDLGDFEDPVIVKYQIKFKE